MTQTYVQIGGQTVDGSLAPADRNFRDAWSLEGDAIVVDMNLARDIHLNRIRAERRLRLEALDIDYQRADESGNSTLKAQIAANKQVLRDITEDTRIQAASTPEELAALDLDTLLS